MTTRSSPVGDAPRERERSWRSRPVQCPGPAGYVGAVSETAAVALAIKTTVAVTRSHRSANGAHHMSAQMPNADIKAHKVSKVSRQQLP